MGYANPRNRTHRGGVLTSNSTATLLTNGSTFTGEWVDVSRWPAIEVAVKTDQSGTYKIQFSPDGTNADSTLPYTYTMGNINAPKRLTTTRRFARVTFTNNSGSDQTYLRLQTIVGDQVPLTSTLSGTIGRGFDATVVRPADYNLSAARGEFEGVVTVGKFGQNASVGTSVEDIWDFGGGYTGFLTAAVAVRIKVGGNANDDAAGSGAQSVTIEGLDGSYNAISETVVTAGASASSPTTATFLRVSRAYIVDVGTYHGANAANIDIETTGGVLVAEIGVGLGQTELAIYTVPAGFTAYIRRAWAVLDGSKVASIQLWRSEAADDVSTPFTGKRIIRNWPGISGSYVAEFNSYIVVSEKSDIWMSGAASSNTIGIAAGFDLILEAN